MLQDLDRIFHYILALLGKELLLFLIGINIYLQPVNYLYF